MHESEKWKWRCSVLSDSWRPHGLQPTRLLHPCDFPGKSTGVGCHCLLWLMCLQIVKCRCFKEAMIWDLDLFRIFAADFLTYSHHSIVIEDFSNIDKATFPMARTLVFSPIPRQSLSCTAPHSLFFLIFCFIKAWVIWLFFCCCCYEPRDQTQVSCIASRFFTVWATREAKILLQQV